MTIHDELVLELVKPDQSGRPKGKIVEIFHTADLEYSCEEPYRAGYRSRTVNELLEWPEPSAELISPDIVVIRKDSDRKTRSELTVAIEVESDLEWDFGHSLRQVKKYKASRNFLGGVIVVIPRKYDRFAPLYFREEIGPYLWEAKRVWECNECGNIVEDKRSLKVFPKCLAKDCDSRQHSLVGLSDLTIEKGFT